ncbi:hypothetical protein Pyrfu_0787 [Pyrolobus fumarii 1A]|uniref:Uncharacterized protein n=1 Tax=Pyrolobus fumarii (strain DSM 11204 / 1A) TaxID=694429 RepID=G0EDH1_PYRF1|nr:hypothetical protein [Pyrolobus fumarii]AEM38656.1 hypothetical protein Pyrfu_0787 [Pyrolobus fumarii 1A]
MDVAFTLALLAITLELIIVYHVVRGRRVPSAVLVVSPVVLAILVVMLVAGPLSQVTPLHVTLFLLGILVASRLGGSYMPGSIAAISAGIAWLLGGGLVEYDARGAGILDIIVPLVYLVAGFAAGSLVARNDKIKYTVILSSGVASACILGVLSTWMILTTRIHVPLVGEPLVALMLVVASLCVVGGCASRANVGRGVALASMGVLSSLALAGYTPYMRVYGSGIEAVPGIVGVAVGAWTILPVLVRREARVTPSDLQLIGLGVATPIEAVAPVPLVARAGALLVTVMGISLAGVAASIMSTRRTRLADILPKVGICVGVLALLALLAAPRVPIAVECSVKPVSLGETGPAPIPDTSIVHYFYPLYWGVINQTIVYSWLAGSVGKEAALEFARFTHVLRLAAEAKGINVSALNISSKHPSSIPQMIVEIDCLGTSLVLPPAVAACPSSITPNGTYVRLDLWSLEWLDSIELSKNESCKLARDYLIMLSDPKLTGNDALRYALYTAMVVSWGERGDLTGTAKLLLNYAFSKNASIEYVNAVVTVYRVPLAGLLHAVGIAGIIAAPILEGVAINRKERS